nr:carboxypeptidase s1 [Quercus suber]
MRWQRRLIALTGGHYGPVYNEYLEQQNAKIKAGKLPKAKEIKLESLIIGNGWYDPLIQYQAYYNFTVYPGNTYNYQPFNKSISDMMYNAMYGEGNCYDQIMDCYIHGGDATCGAADNFCASHVEAVLDIYAERDEYDIREKSSNDHPDPFPYSFFEDYLNSAKVQKAIGAYVNFTSFGPDAVGTAFSSTGDDGREAHTIEDVRKLVEQGIYVVQHAGDAGEPCLPRPATSLLRLTYSGRLQLQLARRSSRSDRDRRTRLRIGRLRQPLDLGRHLARTRQAVRAFRIRAHLRIGPRSPFLPTASGARAVRTSAVRPRRGDRTAKRAARPRADARPGGEPVSRGQRNGGDGIPAGERDVQHDVERAGWRGEKG